jgi:hypothetical protein
LSGKPPSSQTYSGQRIASGNLIFDFYFKVVQNEDLAPIFKPALAELIDVMAWFKRQEGIEVENRDSEDSEIERSYKGMKLMNERLQGDIETEDIASLNQKRHINSQRI